MNELAAPRIFSTAHIPPMHYHYYSSRTSHLHFLATPPTPPTAHSRPSTTTLPPNPVLRLSSAPSTSTSSCSAS
ncbi:uncharacterized protein M421DRAFT_416650 [Didymella exigua CBS 183.55]|uniref:Uncharacterized protein n=1 Tax=Didymella exigua CBS 183.55 TaxID=1150837 RepID=A0A6A5S0E6_9PLEO|nr:uncharacterized protein M421DRAFT_416650 [Didymella exigua CBS 183.55]KAF1933060.1 hypothetical protein M421DRAFT_416650 [Didymella exigua CBS 183.55]